MNVHTLFEFNTYHVLLLALGASVVNSYWIPRFIPGWSPASSALLIISGIVSFSVFPGMPAPLDLEQSRIFWELTSEFVVIIALFGAGIRIDTLFTRTLALPAARLLLVAMPLTIGAVALAGFGIGGLGIAGALLLGAALAPTDPVLAGDLQVGPPQQGNEHPVRLTLTTEAGLNDGLAFPFVYLAILTATHGFAPETWGGEWIIRDVAYRILVGAGGGFVTGLILSRIVFSIPRNNPIANTGTGVIAFAAIILCYGTTELAEGYGFIAVFVAGLTLRRYEPRHKYHQTLHNNIEPIEYLLTAIMLFLLGGIMVTLWEEMTFPALLVAALLIFIIRPVSAWVSLIGTGLKGRERRDVAFFGVRGIGSIYYVSYAMGHGEFHEAPQIWAIMALAIALSAMVHGLTASVIMERYRDKQVQ